MPPTPLLQPHVLDRLKGLSLVARRVVEGALHGLHRSRHQGLSIEFAQHRPYAAGDELKRLDWRVLGRSDRYVIKQYEQETNLRAMLLVDASGSMAYDGNSAHRLAADAEDARGKGPRPGRLRSLLRRVRGGVTGSKRANDANDLAKRMGDGDGVGDSGDAQGQSAGTTPGSKFHYAQVLAASLAHMMLHQGDSVGLMIGGDEDAARHVDPRSAPGHVLAICHALETTSPRGSSSLAEALSQLAARLKRRSLIIVISDLFDDPQRTMAALGQAVHRGHDAILFHVLDPRELDFDLGLAATGVTVVRDMETGAEFETEPHLVRDLVARQVAGFIDEVRSGALALGVHYVECRSDQPVEAVLMRYLRFRQSGHRGLNGSATNASGAGGASGAWGVCDAGGAA